MPKPARRPEPRKEEKQFLVHAELFSHPTSGFSDPASKFDMNVSAKTAAQALKRFRDQQNVPDEGHHEIRVYGNREDIAKRLKPLAQWLSREAIRRQMTGE